MSLQMSRRTFLQAAGTGAAAGGGSMRGAPRDAAADSPHSGPLGSPGFCDLQVNGFDGIDFNDPQLTPDAVARAAVSMEATGVTLFLATLISAPLDRFAACARTLVRSNVAALAGLHMEGPYISPEDGARGAHPREDVSAPTLDDFRRRQEAADGRIRILTVAPEVPGVLDLIEPAVASGVRVSIGHTAASPAEIREAIARGATLSTHLGNGCAQMLPRHPNFLWEQLAADELTAGFIVDGHHLPAATVKAMMRAKTPDRVVLVTDATTAAGRPPGDYMLGHLRVHLDETGRVAVPGQPNLAGSALSLDRAVGNTVRFTGWSPETVLRMAAERPASILGVVPRGRIEADWDSQAFRFTVRRVVV
jgi:N-acetylglucosamine-6-phosphate deacetylase